MKTSSNIIILLILMSSNCFSQNRMLSDSELEDSTVFRVLSLNSDNCDGIEESFKCDLKNENLFLFIPGSVASLEHENDKKIEKKYEIYFYVYGCVTPNSACLTEYNKMVFNYLLKNHKDKWINMIRIDLYGFTEWKKQYLTEK